MNQETFLLGFMNAIGDEFAPPSAPFGALGILLYAFGIFSFGIVQLLIVLSRREKGTLVGNLRGAAFLFQLGFCCLLGGYEYWIRPGFKAYYQGLLGKATLPVFTHTLLNSIPPGIITVGMFSLCLAGWWTIGMQSESKQKFQKLAQVIFPLLGFFLLLALPFALFAPMI